MLRKVGQDLFPPSAKSRKNRCRACGVRYSATLVRPYDLFLNRLLYTEDGRDDYLNAEQYVMLGNYDRDPDRFETMQSIA